MRTTLAILLATATAILAEEPGRITGRVFDEKTGAPVRAVVSVRGGDGESASVASDSSGAFTFEGLPAGDYTVDADCYGYVQGRASQARTVSVRTGTTSGGVELALLKTGAVSGRVVDEDGDPVPGVYVQAKSLGPGGFPFSEAHTDDRGDYRIYNIVPGAYRIVVDGANRVVLSPQLSKTDSWKFEPYPPVFYPGVTDVHRATVVHVEAGSELGNMNIRLADVGRAAVEGRIRVTGPAEPPRRVLLKMESVAFQREQHGLTTDRQFRFEGMMPGTYEITASALNDNGTAEMEGHRLIEVGYADLDVGELPLLPLAVVSGRVVTPEGKTLPAGLFIALWPKRNPSRYSGVSAEVKPDGRFQTLAEVASGDYRLELWGSGEGYHEFFISELLIAEKSADAGDLKIAGSLAELVVRIESGAARLQFDVVDEKGEPAPDAEVLLIPEGKEGLRSCHRVLEISSLAPGDYRAVAVVPDTSFADSDVSRLFGNDATKISVARGEHKKVRLVLAADQP